MSLLSALEARCESKCELCNHTENLSAYSVPPKSGHSIDEQIAICSTCLTQIEKKEQLDEAHWRCLNESIWSPTPSVQVMSYRLLTQLSAASWAADLRNQMYMDESTKEWAEYSDSAIVHKDSNGHILQNGDAVVLIQDLNVKGAGFTAKRGTAVKRIRLVLDNEEHIEGKIDGQQIVILTKYVKKS